MNREPDRSLTTADLARADETRGRGEEQMMGHEAVVDEPRPADPPSRPAPPRPRAGESSQAVSPSEQTTLFPEHDAVEVRKRWSDIQAGFVDEPRRAVEQADALVAEVMKKLAEGFAAERANLEHQWDRGDNVTTEDLRVALRRYRSFFDRLLSV